MKIVYLLFITVFLSNAYASNLTSKELLTSGFNDYKTKNPRSAIKTWFKNSVLERDATALSSANTFNQIQEIYGDYESYEIVDIQELSKRSKLILFVMNYNKGIVYGYFETYQTKNKGWIVTQFNFNTKVSKVWSSSYIYNK